MFNVKLTAEQVLMIEAIREFNPLLDVSGAISAALAMYVSLVLCDDGGECCELF